MLFSDLRPGDMIVGDDYATMVISVVDEGSLVCFTEVLLWSDVHSLSKIHTYNAWSDVHSLSKIHTYNASMNSRLLLGKSGHVLRGVENEKGQTRPR